MRTKTSNHVWHIGTSRHEHIETLMTNTTVARASQAAEGGLASACEG